MSENTNTSKPLTVFLDAIGRAIVGEAVESTEHFLKVKNPVILNVVPTEGGRMTVQLYPLFFREFLADKTEDSVYTYNKSNITQTDISALDFRLNAQYNQLFSKDNVFVTPEPVQNSSSPTQPEKNSVVNLFDE